LPSESALKIYHT
jgi:acetyl-CoA synthetase